MNISVAPARRQVPATAWVGLAAALGAAVSGGLVGLLGWPRDRFVAAWGAAVIVFAVTWGRSLGLRPGVQLGRRWRGGVVGGLVFAALVVRGVLAQPASPAPRGGALVFALLRDGVLYAVADAVLLTIVPVLSVFAARRVATASSPARRLGTSALALLASLVVTAAYHLGFPEFRGPSLLQPLVGNGLITLSYLLAGSPLAPLLAHVAMHVAAVLHGAATVVQLPPHLP